MATHICLKSTRSIVRCLEPGLKSHALKFLYKTGTFVAEKGVEDVLDLSRRHADVISASVDVSADDVVAIGHLLQGLGTCDDYFTSGENGCRDLFHFLRWFEFYFNRGILVGLETHREDVGVVSKVFSHFHEVDVVIQTIIAVYHDHSKVFIADDALHVQVAFENFFKLTDDALTIEEVAAPRHLNRTIWENFYTLP